MKKLEYEKTNKKVSNRLLRWNACQQIIKHLYLSTADDDFIVGLAVDSLEPGSRILIKIKKPKNETR